jgi:hypothetical protein
VNVVEEYYQTGIKLPLVNLPGVTGSLSLLEDVALMVGSNLSRTTTGAKTAPQLMELTVFLGIAIPFGQPVDILRVQT